MEENKRNKCRYRFPTTKLTNDNKLQISWICRCSNCIKHNKIITDDFCENCPNYKSQYIKYPITVNAVNNEKVYYSENKELGKLCKIKPCGKEYNDKTYLGFFLGNLPLSIHTSYNEVTKELSNGLFTNPAIFIPELGKIIFGCESWWSIIENPEDLKEITDEDINNVWYVQALKHLYEEEE